MMQVLQITFKMKISHNGQTQSLLKIFHGQFQIKVFITIIKMASNTFHQLLEHSKLTKKYGSKTQHYSFSHGQTAPLLISKTLNSKFTVFQDPIWLKLQQQQSLVHPTKLQNPKVLKSRFLLILMWLSCMVNLMHKPYSLMAKRLITQIKPHKAWLSQLQLLKHQAILLSRVVMFTCTILKTNQEQLTSTTVLTTLME